MHFSGSFRYLYGKFMEIVGLEAPGNYSGPFQYNMFRLLERPKSLNSMSNGIDRLISGMNQLANAPCPAVK